jgi:hypothetical protein
LGSFVSGGYNLIGAVNGGTGFGAPGDQLGSVASPLDPKLGPLQDNGGPTPTMALLTGSPAIDKGNSGGLTTDQRGRQRPFDIPNIPNAPGGNGSDIGAFEVNLALLNIRLLPPNVVLSWSATPSGYNLQATLPPLTPTSTWTYVPGTPSLVNGQYTLTNSIGPSLKFYRLSNP